MLPGDLTATQAGVVGNNARESSVAAGGDALIASATESTLFFQNLTAAGFLSCSACANVAAGGAAASINNSPTNVYGEFLSVGNDDSDSTGTNRWFDATNALNRLVLYTGGSIPSQVLAEVDRKADDGRPSTGQLRFAVGGSAVGVCTGGGMVATPATGTWANPSQSNCAGAWLF